MLTIILGVLVVLFLIGALGGTISSRHQPRPKTWIPTPDIGDVTQQLRIVMSASFGKKRLLNAWEYQTFKILEDDIAAMRNGFRVFAQTSLGEILSSPDGDAYRSINSKRVDILIVDPFGWPVVAVEYQGRGHYLGTAAARDAVKKEALRKAGVAYIEVMPSDDADQIRQRVRQVLPGSAGRHQSAPFSGESS